MKILAVLGTNRRGGLISKMCGTVLSEAEKNGHETETINLYDYEIKHCTGCWSCVKTNDCVLGDDFSAVFEKLKQADSIILEIPCYWGNVPGIVKTFIDRHTAAAMFKPEQAAMFRDLAFGQKLKSVINALKSFGALDGIGGKKFVFIGAMTFPFPVSHLSGDYRGMKNAVKIYVKKLKCRSFKSLVFTDSLCRFLPGKEARYMKKAKRIGASLL